MILVAIPKSSLLKHIFRQYTIIKSDYEVLVSGRLSSSPAVALAFEPHPVYISWCAALFLEFTLRRQDREWKTFNKNRRAEGMLNPLRDKSESEYRGGGKGRDL